MVTVPDFVNMTTDELRAIDLGYSKYDKREWAVNAHEWINIGTPMPLDIARDGVAIIVGNGFELPKHIQYINNTRHFVFGVNGACKYIQADIGISIDIMCPREYYTETAKSGGFLVATPISNIESAKDFGRRVFLINTCISARHYYDERCPMLFSHSNTIQTVLHMAYLMGFREIQLLATNFVAFGDERSQQLVSGIQTTPSLHRHAVNIVETIRVIEKAGVKFRRMPYGLLRKLYESS